MRKYYFRRNNKGEAMRMTPHFQESIRCGASSCSCARFRPGKVRLRSCDLCGHGWVEHALGKLQAHPASSSGPVEVALPGLVFDLSSLVLFGAQAIPVQLKILLDRLYSVLSPEQVGRILNGLGWSLGDYVRGYMLQHPGGKVLDRWSMATPEEELLVLKQFLRFGETRPIVELMMLQYLEGYNVLSDVESRSPRENIQSDVRTNKRTSLGDGRRVDGNDTSDCHEKFPGGQSVLLPFHFPQSTIFCSTKDFSRNTLAPKHDREKNGRLEDDGLDRGGSESVLSIKTDPDKSNPSPWHQNPIFHHDRVLLQKQLIHQEKTASLSSSFNFSFFPSSLYPPITSSSSYHLQHPQKSQTLPSFSSSFQRPLHSSFSSPLTSPCSSLHPLPSSLCSLPSLFPAGGRKGRVSCGVCGKSFYDKGTLKIHYNAVHLKIKHRCTVLGCTMVFSSLRSRNRHSANPNPRLHTGGSREPQPYRNAPCGQGSTRIERQIYEVKQETQTVVGTSARENSSLDTHHGAASPTPPLFPPAPPSGGFSPPCAGPLRSQRWWQQNPPLPKKKPRKSSMPVKIERDVDQGRKQKDEN